MLKQLQKYHISFVEKEIRLRHYCIFGAPSDWAKERGATHTLETIDGPRPAQVYKTFALIGVDESDTEDIVWERWQISSLHPEQYFPPC
tara:strand:- start:545 stop:811 length:267 start_codon:yes stop_codon:yes gene_type:complete